MKTELSYAEASCHGAKWGNWYEHRFGSRQMKLNALHNFSEGKVTGSVVSNNVNEHDSPLIRLNA